MNGYVSVGLTSNDLIELELMQLLSDLHGKSLSFFRPKTG